MKNGTEYQMAMVENGAGAAFPEDKCICHLFQEQAKRTPDRVAVVSADERITYKELDEKSNRFGRYLQTKGVKPETLVAICLDRTINMIVGILSILKLGGAYVPIDPDYPSDRIAFMLDDSASSVLISQTSLKSKLPVTNAETIWLDDIADELEQASSAPLCSDAGPDNLAYVIYTSGSTGRPKGVMIENRNVVRLLFNDRFQFDFGEYDAWSIFHSFCFDFSVWEMYGALLYGGKAVIVPKQATRDPHAFINVILKERVTVINQTPSAFYGLIPYLMEVSDRASFLRYVIFGGEKLNPGKLGEVKKLFPQVMFVNMYGITETTVHVTYKEITEKEIAEGFSNIGKPIPTLKVYIFDENMQLVPRGVEGELCVGGHGVARGYLNRPDLTEARFTPNPLNPDEIIYRSGDLACMRENGDLEYFGRMDNQIQLRGFRIELGEIESVLVGLDEIKDCVIAVDEAASGDVRLIAYIIPAGKQIPVNQLKEMIGRKLPEYMIPSFFITVDEFPLTGNGKLDLKKLPCLDLDTVSFEKRSAPENETEMLMVDIWSELLCVDKNKIGREYNFFEIGGHSLTAMMLLGKVRGVFKKEITIRDIYANPRLNDLCRVMLQLADIKEQTVTCSTDVITPESIWPIKSTQLVYWLGAFLFKLEISNVCEVYRLDGFFDFDRFQLALNKTAECNDSLWCRFSKRKPAVHMAAPDKYEVEHIDWNALNTDKKYDHLNDLIVEKLHKPFDLSQVPLFRMIVIKEAAENHLLLVSFPHIICDIAAVNAFVQDVFDAYASPETQDRAVPQPLKISAREIIDREIEYLKSLSYTEDVKFWQQKLSGIDLLKASRKYFLPRRKRISSGRQLYSKIKLNTATMDALHKAAAQSNASIQIIILAVIQATLHTLSKQDDIFTAMVYDMSGMYPYPPAMQLNAAMIPVVSTFTQDTTYMSLISGLKTFLVEALGYMRVPDSILHCIPLFSALRDRPWLSGSLKTFGRFYSWYHRKSKVNKDVVTTYLFYIFGMIALGLKNVRKKKQDRTRFASVVFNVLPSFYESRELWSNDSLRVSSIGDRELMMNPCVFEEGSKFQDANLLNFDLLRDSHDDACLYIWGGGLNPEGFICMERAFHYHLNSMIEDTDKPVLMAQAEALGRDSVFNRRKGSDGEEQYYAESVV